MISKDRNVRISGGHVVAEDVDGEVIAINLETGAYYSFRDSAALVWRHLLAGETRLSEIIIACGDKYDAAGEAMSASVCAFLGCMETEGLLVSLECESRPNDGHDGTISKRSAEPRAAFSDPIYEKYTDMQEFLLVDPIHEVDVTEWPEAQRRERS